MLPQSRAQSDSADYEGSPKASCKACVDEFVVQQRVVDSVVGCK